MRRLKIKNAETLEGSRLKAVREFTTAIDHPVRMSIVRLIDRETELNVTSIHQTLGLEQSVTSAHLRILRDANIVKTRRVSRTVLYTLNTDRLDYYFRTINAWT